MKTFKIVYIGATSEEVKSNNEKQALELFWSDYKDLSDVEIVSVEEITA